MKMKINKMRKQLILFLLLVTAAGSAFAQTSTMTDDQVMSLVVREHERGSSNAQIVTKLMQQGVDISQIRRVRDKYQRQLKQGGVTGTSAQLQGKETSRLRTNNGKPREDYGKGISEESKNYSNYRITAQKDDQYKHTFDEDDEEYMDFQNEMDGIIPDTAMMIKRLLAEREAKIKKVFGRDIFNNKELSFEPNMNIATPQNYRLGPGDAVIIDIYGASQKTIESTVSPDGEVTIEGFGPVSVAGLTVAQANARLRNTLGSRYRSSKIKLTVL